MLQTPTTETEQSVDGARAAAVPELQRTLHARYSEFGALAGHASHGFRTGAGQSHPQITRLQPRGQSSALTKSQAGPGTRERALMLQRTIGNQATLRLLDQQASPLIQKGSGGDHEQGADPAAPATLRPTPGAAWDFSKISVSSPATYRTPSPLSTPSVPGIVQSKLAVGEVDDPLEREADRVADQVMRMSDPRLGNGDRSAVLQRKCAECEEKDQELSRKESCNAATPDRAGKPITPEPERELHPWFVAKAGLRPGGFPVSGDSRDEVVHRKPLAANSAPSSQSPAHVQNAISSGGHPLDRSSLSFFEPRLGCDLSSVRIHSGSLAAESARAIDARAYTLGNNIVFGRGEFRTNSETSKQLLAHELVHVMQQGGSTKTVQRKPIDDTPDIKMMSRSEAVQILGKELHASFDENTAAMNVIANTLEMPFTEQNARTRLLRLNAAFSMLEREEAALVYGTLTVPVNDKQRHLKERFDRLDHRFRTPLLGLLQERAKEKPGKADQPQQPKYEEGKATWVELHPGVWGYVPEQGMTLKSVASYISRNPALFEGLVRVNNSIPKDAPIPVGTTVIVPVELIDQDRAWGEMSQPTRKSILSVVRAKYSNDQIERLMQVKPPPLGPGMYGFLPVMTTALSPVVGAIETIIDALLTIIKKAEYGIAFAAGIVHGIFASLWDTVSGIAKMIYDLIKSILTGELIDDIEKFVSDIKGVTIEKLKDMLGDWAVKWHAKLNSKSAWIAGHAHGYLTGYVMAEAAMLLLTGGAATEAKAAFWTSEVGKAVRASRAFIAAEKNLTKLAEAGGKVAKVIEESKKGRAGVVVKGVVKVVEVAGWTAETIGEALSLPGKIAADVIDKALQHAKQLGPFFKRIGKFADRVKKFIFGCLSPCNWDPATVENLLKHLKDDKQLEILCDSANRAKLVNEKWFEKTVAVGDKLPDGYYWREGKIVRNKGMRQANYAPLEFDKQAKKIQVSLSAERISNPSVMNRNYKDAVRERIREVYRGKPLSEAQLDAKVAQEVGQNAVHHLIPDNLVQDHPLGVAARKAGYDLDRGSNLQGLKKTEGLTDVDAGDIGHWSSHPNYDKLVEADLTTAQKAIEKDFGSLDNALKTDAGKKRMVDEMRKIEDKFRNLFEKGDKALPIDPVTGRITVIEPKKGEKEVEETYA